MKFFYFVAVLSDVIFSFNKGKNCFHFITILYGELYTYIIYFKDLDNLSLTYELYAFLLDCQ